MGLFSRCFYKPKILEPFLLTSHIVCFYTNSGNYIRRKTSDKITTTTLNMIDSAVIKSCISFPKSVTKLIFANNWVVDGTHIINIIKRNQQIKHVVFNNCNNLVRTDVWDCWRTEVHGNTWCESRSNTTREIILMWQAALY